MVFSSREDNMISDIKWNESENIIRKKKSNYNTNIIMDKCKFPDCCNNSDDSHHIHEQQDADENGNFDNFHKNDKHNL